MRLECSGSLQGFGRTQRPPPSTSHCRLPLWISPVSPLATREQLACVRRSPAGVRYWVVPEPATPKTRLIALCLGCYRYTRSIFTNAILRIYRPQGSINRRSAKTTSPRRRLCQTWSTRHDGGRMTSQSGNLARYLASLASTARSHLALVSKDKANPYTSRFDSILPAIAP